MSDSIDIGELRRALGTFITGVTVITTADGDEMPHGFTANSFTSVSLDPPLVLFCIARSVTSCQTFVHASHFAVSVLAEDQRDTSKAFATKDADRFSQVRWRARETGSPIMEGAAAWFDCSVYMRLDAGDHWIIIGRVAAFGNSGAEALGFYRGDYLTRQEEPEPPKPAPKGVPWAPTGLWFEPFDIEVDDGVV